MGSILGLVVVLALACPAHAGIDVVVKGAFLSGSPNGGDPAPDANGVFFGSQIPVIDDSGEVTFPCSFTTGSGGTALVRGSTTPGDRHIIVRLGDPAPDGNGNFQGFDGAIVSINDAGQVAFSATFTGTFNPQTDGSGTLRGAVAPDHLTLLTRSGQTVDGVQLGTATTPALNGGGEVVFSQLNAIVRAGGGAASVVAQVGQAAPDASGPIVSILQPAVINDAGQVAIYPTVNHNAVLNVEFVRADGSTLTQVVRDGDPAPDGNGTFDLFMTALLLQHPTLNASGEIAFLAALAGATGNATTGVFRSADPAHVQQIARRGAATPDANGTFLSIDLAGVDVLALNDAGQVAFQATLTGTKNGSADNKGIFRGDGSTLVRVVRKGQAAPDGNGTFSTLGTPAINATGQVAFAGTLAGTSRGNADNVGIFLYDDVHGLVQVVRLGDPLLGSTIGRVGFAPDQQYGRKHVGINAGGQIAFQFDLNDGREGIAVWSPGTTTTTTTSVTTTTTTLGGSATSTTVGTTSSTTSTTLGAGSTTSTTTATGSSTTAPATTSTTHAAATTTTSTAPPCTTLRCTIDAATGGPNCAGETIPLNIAKKLGLAISQAELAPSATPKKAKRLEKSSARLLRSAARLAGKAARGRHPKLSTACSVELVSAIEAGRALIVVP